MILFGHAEAQRHLIEKARLGGLVADGVEPGADMEDQFVFAGLEAGFGQDRAVGAAVMVGRGFGDQAAATSSRNFSTRWRNTDARAVTLLDVSATPPAARTATTMPVGPEPGNPFGQGKFVPAIAMAHEIPYVATATVADLRDLEYKVRRAMTFRGARYIHILVPCPLGWGSASHDTLRLSRLAKETGVFPVFEAEHGELKTSTKIRRLLPVEEYLRPQKRFAHLFGKNPAVDTIARLQALADKNIRKYDLLSKEAY